MKNRIVQLINNEGLTSSKFADTIGVQRSSISHILSGRNNPSLDFIQKIMTAFPEVNADWLLSGEGDMYKQQASSSLFTDIENENRTQQALQQPPKLKKESSVNTNQAAEPENMFEMNSSASGKQIEKVVVFYTDKTFKEYKPS